MENYVNRCQIASRERMKSRELALRLNTFDIEFFVKSIYNDYRFLNELISFRKVWRPKWNGIILKLKTTKDPQILLQLRIE